MSDESYNQFEDLVVTTANKIVKDSLANLSPVEGLAVIILITDSLFESLAEEDGELADVMRNSVIEDIDNAIKIGKEARKMGMN